MGATVSTPRHLHQEVLNMIWTEAHVLAEREHTLTRNLLPWSPQAGPAPWALKENGQPVCPYWKRLVEFQVHVDVHNMGNFGNVSRPMEPMRPNPRLWISRANRNIARVDRAARFLMRDVVPFVAVNIRYFDPALLEHDGPNAPAFLAAQNDPQAWSFHGGPHTVIPMVQSTVHEMRLHEVGEAHPTPATRFRILRHLLGNEVRHLCISIHDTTLPASFLMRIMHAHNQTLAAARTWRVQAHPTSRAWSVHS
jgi:hypothetical protein